jgi:hypothetical protein
VPFHFCQVPLVFPRHAPSGIGFSNGTNGANRRGASCCRVARRLHICGRDGCGDGNRAGEDRAGPCSVGRNRCTAEGREGREGRQDQRQRCDYLTAALKAIVQPAVAGTLEEAEDLSEVNAGWFGGLFRYATLPERFAIAFACLLSLGASLQFVFLNDITASVLGSLMRHDPGAKRATRTRTRAPRTRCSARTCMRTRTARHAPAHSPITRTQVRHRRDSEKGSHFHLGGPGDGLSPVHFSLPFRVHCRAPGRCLRSMPGAPRSHPLVRTDDSDGGLDRSARIGLCEFAPYIILGWQALRYRRAYIKSVLGQVLRVLKPPYCIP